MQPGIVIVDYGVSNLRNVEKAFQRLGARVLVSSSPADIDSAGAVVLPGVGAFGAAIERIKARHLHDPLRRAALAERKPFLGICLGMQLMARDSDEGGMTEGLGLVDATVRRLPATSAKIRLPHVGWNSVTPRVSSRLLRDIPAGADFYFVHSYHVVCSDPALSAASCMQLRRRFHLCNGKRQPLRHAIPSGKKSTAGCAGHCFIPDCLR
jgi:imidazole glycerol-phosphate synthase subunit HisH